MIYSITVYLILTSGLLSALTYMILCIGRYLNNCPGGAEAARPAALTVACGFAVIGLGGVATIGAAFFLVDHSPAAVLFALGSATICLGLGFTHAVATLRAVLREPAAPAPDATPAPVADAA